jgi:methionyl-tRNA formyltransferase
MKKPFIWKALFSQSGSEIYEISKNLGRFPDAIITNKSPENLEKINPSLLEEAYDRFVFIPRIATPEEYKTSIGHANIVTLHGFLRILPPEACFRYTIFNGHPGLITRYPELKGKDPQKRAWDEYSTNTRPYHGHVIHKVVPEVDEGTIESTAYFKTNDLYTEYQTVENYIAQLHKIAIHNWVAFLKKKILINNV